VPWRFVFAGLLLQGYRWGGVLREIEWYGTEMDLV
jgi:hypothetical protein